MRAIGSGSIENHGRSRLLQALKDALNLHRSTRHRLARLGCRAR
jgi:hypothetical protein